MYLKKERLLKYKNLHRGPKNDKYAYKVKLQTQSSTGYNNMVNGVNIGYEGNLIYIVNKNSQEEGHMNIYWKEAFLENIFTFIKENSICKCWSSIHGRKRHIKAHKTQIITEYNDN